MNERCISVDDRTEWASGLAEVPHAFAHTWENCHATAVATGHPTYLYTATAGEHTRIACPISERTYGEHTDIYTPYGFSGFVGTGGHPDFHTTWRQFVGRRGYVCGYFGLNPVLDQSAYFDAAELASGNAVHVLDLKQPIDRLHGSLHLNRRRQLARLNRMAGEFTERRDDLLEFFLAAAPGFYRTRASRPGVPLTADFLRCLFESGNVIVIGAGAGNDIEAASVFAYTPWVGDFLFNVSVGAGRRYSAALIWYGLLRLRSAGVTRLNLGGGIRPGDGVAEFKARFGGDVLPHRAARQVYRQDVFEALCRASGVDPRDPEGYFPPYRRLDATAR